MKKLNTIAATLAIAGVTSPGGAGLVGAQTSPVVSSSSQTHSASSIPAGATDFGFDAHSRVSQT